MNSRVVDQSECYIDENHKETDAWFEQKKYSVNVAMYALTPYRERTNLASHFSQDGQVKRNALNMVAASLHLGEFS